MQTLLAKVVDIRDPGCDVLVVSLHVLNSKVQGQAAVANMKAVMHS